MNENNKMEYTGNREDLISQGYESCGNCHSLGNTNPVKLGRCFSFLNNWYGFHQGNGSNQHEQKEKVFIFANSIPKNQTELAESYGITKQTMNNYMRMANMIPELEDLIETNIRQRGDVGGSAKKVGLRIKELDRLYGIKNGGSGFYGNQHIMNP